MKRNRKIGVIRSTWEDTTEQIALVLAGAGGIFAAAMVVATILNAIFGG